MKFKVLLFLSVCFSSFAQAQNSKVSAYTYKTDPLYLQVTVGGNHSMSENTDKNEDDRDFALAKRTMDYCATIALGKEFTPVLGWRLSAGYDRNHGANHWFGGAYHLEDPMFYKFQSGELFADLTVDIIDFLLPNLPSHRFDLKGFAGVGFAGVWGLPDYVNADNEPFSDHNGLHVGGRLGIRAGYRVTRSLELGLEAAMHGFDDNFSGYKYKYPLDLRQQAGVFLAYRLGQYPAPLLPEVSEVLPPTDEVVEAPIVFTPALIFVTPEVEEVKRRVLSGSAYLDFIVNKTDINPTYRRNTVELAKIRASIDDIKDDPTVSITAIGIHGYASPEGPYSNNIRLAKGRAAALRQYLLKTYNMKDELITSTYTPEDWGNLRKTIETGAYPEKDKWLAIIDSDMEPDAKDWKLKKTFPAVYKQVLAEVYPALRHSDYTINYNVRNFTLEEAKEIIKTHPERLSQSEMYNVAKSYGQGTSDYRNALMTALKCYPNDATANLNVANMYLEEGDVASAMQYLAKAGDSKEAAYARGVAEALNKNYDAAAAHFMKAKAAGLGLADDALKQIRR